MSVIILEIRTIRERDHDAVDCMLVNVDSAMLRLIFLHCGTVDPSCWIDVDGIACDPAWSNRVRLTVQNNTIKAKEVQQGRLGGKSETAAIVKYKRQRCLHRGGLSMIAR